MAMRSVPSADSTANNGSCSCSRGGSECGAARAYFTEAPHLLQAIPGVQARGGKDCDVAGRRHAPQLRAVFQADDVHVESLFVEPLGGLDHLALGAGIESHSVRQQADPNAFAEACGLRCGVAPCARLPLGMRTIPPAPCRPTEELQRFRVVPRQRAIALGIGIQFEVQHAAGAKPRQRIRRQRNATQPMPHSSGCRCRLKQIQYAVIRSRSPTGSVHGHETLDQQRRNALVAR